MSAAAIVAGAAAADAATPPNIVIVLADDAGGVRSVCCIRYPARIRPGTVIEEVTGAIDLLPTLAGLAGLAELAGVATADEKPLDGIDLGPVLTDGPDAAAPPSPSPPAKRR